MKKLLKKIIAMLAIFTCLIGTIIGCSSNSSGNNETKEIMQEKESTTNPYTKYGEFEIKEEYASYFYDLVIENGSVISMNEVVSDDDTYRGNVAICLLVNLKMNYTNFVEKYLPIGTQDTIVPYDDNYSIKYTEKEKFIFKYTYKDEEQNVIHFDICRFK